ncbi:transporter substrate-binding domain-containing protein [Bacillus massilinigeriensis]|uniref:transporter substrate-binding domain-containing protein n=1 Tax=Bacillus mediterraneensis TaxID=1805474 RepID=UPI0008F85968|nr:transporter substrate-binding domain-containing protein [Bacillus mediterraneensis]
MKKAVSMLLAVTLIFLLAACGSSKESKMKASSTEGEEKKVLTMGTSSDYPPFEFVDTAKSDEIIGFDIDLAKLVAGELGYEVEVKDIDFNGLIPALQANQIDFVMAGMTPTDDRKKSVDFSDVYYTARHMIVSQKKSKMKSESSLKGKTVGVQLASIQEDKAKELAKLLDLKIETRNRIPELIQELKSGRVDAVIIEDTVANGYFKKNPDLYGAAIKGNDEEAGSAIAFPKNSELTKEFNSVLKEKLSNGEVDKLVVKWFGGK